MTEQGVIRALRALLMTMVIGLLFSQQGAAQSATFQRGDHVWRKEVPTTGLPSNFRPSEIPLTVIALGGDRVRIERRPPAVGAWPLLTQYALYVNDVAVSGFSRQFIARLAALAPETLAGETVPDGLYYVMGDGYTVDGRPVSMRGMFSGMSLEPAQ
jgi:hypothetical protein